VQAAVAQVAERVRQKQIMLQVVLPTRLPINGDAALLQRLLVNLLHNALKYSSKHGIILIAGHYDPVAACLQLSIEDNGYTLPADMLPHVFDRCHQPAEAAHSARRSIGVSLAFCHAVVALHGGAVWAEAPLRGLRVVCSLPTQLRASDASEGGV
jgi:two-component system, OmpR family, sensor histidine kinase BaeS